MRKAEEQASKKGKKKKSVLVEVKKHRGFVTPRVKTIRRKTNFLCPTCKRQVRRQLSKNFLPWHRFSEKSPKWCRASRTTVK